MIIRIIRKGDRIMIGMNIGEMIIKVQHKRMPDNMIIDRIEIKIFQHRRITIVNSNKEVVIRINKIDHPAKTFISQKHLGNFSMILGEKTRISTMLDIHNLNRVKPVIHQSQISIFAGIYNAPFFNHKLVKSKMYG